MKHIHLLWFRFNQPQSFCSWGGSGLAVTWDKRYVDCPRCLEHLDNR